MLSQRYALHQRSLFYVFSAILFLCLFAIVYAQTAHASEVKDFHLYATDGTLKLADGNEVYIWGYSLKNEPGTATYPAPTLTVNEGDQVKVTLTNIGAKKPGQKRVAHTIHWHGLDTDQRNDGVPHTSPGLQAGDSFTYSFTATHAGTYFYHCHVDTIEHLQMGMHGSFIVKAKGGVNEAWTGGPKYDKEYVFHINEIDPVWHKAVEEGQPYDRTVFHPAYWTINGKSFPDTEQDPSTYVEGVVGDTILVRLINAGYHPRTFHMHGYHFQIVATDGRPLKQFIEKDTVLLGPGERVDLLVTFDQSGAFPFHSHSIIDNTNNGVYPGGLHTMIYAHTAPDRVMLLSANEPRATVNDTSLTLTSPPVNIRGSTYVPLRFMGEQFGAEVQWIQEEQSVIYTKAGKAIQLWVDRNEARVDASMVALNAPPKLANGSTMVPLRFISEQLGAKVMYDGSTGEISISYLSGNAKQALLPNGHGNHKQSQSGQNQSEQDQGEQHAGNHAPAADENTVVVEISRSAYMPANIEIKKGQTITWVNNDMQAHDVLELYGVFGSPLLQPGASYSFTFHETGEFTYYCSLHPTMQGTVTVVE